jgi:hypothetical protein
MIGATKLTPMAGSTSTQILFKVDSALQVGPLAVYNPGGMVYTLDPKYRVFDPTSAVTRVIPPSFQQGDTVTLYGQSLFLASLSQSFGPPSSSTNFIVTGPINFQDDNFVQIGNVSLHVLDPAVTEDGSRMTFGGTCISPITFA